MKPKNLLTVLLVAAFIGLTMPMTAFAKEPESALFAAFDTLKAPNKISKQAEVIPASGGSVVDLLVMYTPKAKADAKGRGGMEAKIVEAVAMANRAYTGGNFDMHINLVGMEEIFYIETGNASARLADNSDGKMDEMYTLRSQYGADQVMLITADTDHCGIGYIITDSGLNSDFSPYAFSIVNDDLADACLSDFASFSVKSGGI